jgi:hypothetical protein
MSETERKSSTIEPEERVVIRLPSALRRQMEALASSNQRSLSGEIRMAMIHWATLKNGETA